MPGPLAERILAVIAANPDIAGREICDRLGIVQDRLYRHLRPLLRAHLVERAAYGRYRLAQIGERAKLSVNVGQSSIAPASMARLMAGR